MLTLWIISLPLASWNSQVQRLQPAGPRASGHPSSTLHVFRASANMSDTGY